MSGQMCGGVGDAQAATEEVQLLCDGFRTDVEKKPDTSVSEFKAVSFRTQVVAGMNYFVKVHIGNDVYVHLRIYKPLPHTGADPSLTDCQMGKTIDDSIEFF